MPSAVDFSYKLAGQTLASQQADLQPHDHIKQLIQQACKRPPNFQRDQATAWISEIKREPAVTYLQLGCLSDHCIACKLLT